MFAQYLIRTKEKIAAQADTFAGLLKEQEWLLIFTVIFATFIAERLILFIFSHFTKLTRKTKTDLDDIIVAKSKRPVGNYVLLFGLYIVFHILRLPKDPFDIAKFGLMVTRVLVISNTLYLVWQIIDIIGAYLIRMVVKTSTKLDDQLIPILEKSLKVLVFVIGVVFIIQSLGYSVSGLVAGLGIGGLAVAMASQKTLSNLFGSVMILADKPFKVGDRISAGGHDGIVEKVGFRSTRIRTFPKTVITIPNATIADLSIDNFSQMPKRRVKMTVGVTYDTNADQMQKAVDEIKTILKNSKDVDQELILVYFTDFGASSLDILVYYFTVTTKWQEHLKVRQEINLAIMRKVEELGLSIAFPTRTVHIVKENDNS